MRRWLVFYAVAISGYAVCTLDAEAVDGAQGVPIDYAWVSTDAAGASYLHARPDTNYGPRGCGKIRVLDADQRRQAIGLRLTVSPPPPVLRGTGGYSCGLSIPQVRLDGPVDGRRVLDLVAGTDLTSRGPLDHVDHAGRLLSRDGLPRAR